MVPQQAVMMNGYMVILICYGTGPSLGKMYVYIKHLCQCGRNIYLKHLFVNLRMHSHRSHLKKNYLLSITLVHI